MADKKTWRKWVVRKTTQVHEVRAYTVEEARALFDANESVCVDTVEGVEQSDALEVERNT